MSIRLNNILRCRSRGKARNWAWGRSFARRMRELLVVFFIFGLAQALVARTASGQEGTVDEYKLKAALLYHLTDFVEWPNSLRSDRHAPLLVCILGQDPFANSLTASMPRETDSGKPVIVRQLQNDSPISGCHILYIASSERKNAARIFPALKGSGILTVGEMTQFAARGGIIQFSLEDRRVQFDINVDAASRAGLKISSKLLALAQIVRD